MFDSSISNVQQQLGFHAECTAFTLCLVLESHHDFDACMPTTYACDISKPVHVRVDTHTYKVNGQCEQGND